MTLANIDDMRARARRKLPKLFFDYIDGAAFSETTARRNRSDFDDATGHTEDSCRRIFIERCL